MNSRAQRNNLSVPAVRERRVGLYYFEETSEVWSRSPEELRDALISGVDVLTPAMEIVVAHHIDTATPIIIEGDGTLPALFARELMRTKAATGQVRANLLVESDESVVVANMMVRARGIDGRTETEARAKWLYGEWLTDQARTFQLPVHEPRPWPTLIDRIRKDLKSKAPLVG